MKRLLLILSCLAIAAAETGRAASTINGTNAYAYSANVGWMSWRPDATSGVSIGEFICSGYIYAANVGWINVGSGFPLNHIQYQNNSAGDFGLNYSVDPASPGEATLRGYAYGANIGWINFEAQGNPRVRFSDGRLQGYAYAANVGWINLGDASFAVQTDSIAPGVDSDGDGMADAFEWKYFNGLSATETSDFDGDGMSDLAEYFDGTDPTSATSRFAIVGFSTIPARSTARLTWTSTPGRLYRIETTTDIVSVPWSLDTSVAQDFAPDPGSQTTRTVLAPAGTKRFYRVGAVRPLP